jgi:hypothetical protein
MDELAEGLRRAERIVAAEYLSLAAFLYPRLLSAARALIRNDSLLVEPAPVKIILNMGDNHVPLAYKYPAARHKLQIFNKDQIMQACAGNFASVYFDRIKQGYRR